MMFTLRQLEAFFWAGKLASFTEAADYLCISQSALSKRIAELEAVLGKELFDRSAYRPRPTAFGKRLLDKVHPLLGACKAIEEMAADDSLITGTLSFGLTESVAQTWLPAAVAVLREKHPGVVLEPRVDRAAALLERVRKGSTALAVLPAITFEKGLHYRYLADLEFQLVVAPSLLGDTQGLRLSHLALHPVLMHVPESNAARLFEQWLAQREVYVQRALATNSTMAALHLVLAGVGIGFLPSALVEPYLRKGVLVGTPPAECPKLPYFSVRREGDVSALIRTVEEIFAAQCDFGAQA